MIAILAPGQSAPPSPASEPLTVAATSPARLPNGPQILASQTKSLLIVCEHLCLVPIRSAWGGLAVIGLGGGAKVPVLLLSL